MRRAFCLALLLAAPAVAGAEPAPAAWELAPIRFEVSRDGRLIWRGAVAPAPDFRDTDRATVEIDNFCRDDGHEGSRMRLVLTFINDPLRPRQGRREYYVSFTWTRGFSSDPRRFDACDRSEGRLTSEQNGTLRIGRHGRATFALPDGLTLLLRR